MKIEKIIKDCLAENVFGEDEVVEARAILTWMDRGRKEAEKVSPMAVRNLVEMGFARGNKLKIDLSEPTVGFCLAVAGAKGFIKQVKSGS